MRSAFLLLSSIALAVGCSASNDTDLFGSGGEGGSGGSPGSGGGGAASSSSSGIDITVGAGGGGVGGGAGGGSNLIAEVYGHSPDELYRLDPTTKEVTVVGAFQGCSSVIDIALDKDSNLYGTTFGGFYKIDKDTASCSLIAQGSYPNSLSFVPKGTVDPNVEALVGYNGSSYIRIDTVTGAVTSLGGSLPSGFSSSGDIVSVIGGPTYLTVVGSNCGDCIFEIDPANGTMIKNWGSVGYGAVYGLAFWAGAAYGFSNGGDLFEVKFANNAVTTTPIAIPGAPLNLQFWGAGSTTSAPPIPIPE
ncbi:MAG: hypothetical protein HUU21_26615 [Polyangiaceae bacterium]|nr:hypothetical protein [Polyangiaceae bacterium]NUQ77124.1 hypothetical protein [Polyangiaceae bacterium]